MRYPVVSDLAPVDERQPGVLQHPLRQPLQQCHDDRGYYQDKKAATPVGQDRAKRARPTPARTRGIGRRGRGARMDSVFTVQIKHLRHERGPVEVITGDAPSGAGRARPAIARAGVIGFVLAGALSLTLAGCGGGQKKHSATSTTKATTGSTTTTSTPPKAIASLRDTTLGGNGPIPFQVSIYDLRRDGPFLVLDFGVKCLLPANHGCQTFGAFAPGYQPVDEIANDTYSLAGIGLVDPANLKAYLPVRDSQGRPYASSTGGEIAGSQTHLEWVRYPLPPSSVRALDVTFPDAGPVIRDVPITGGAAPTPAGQLVAAQPGRFAQPPDSTNTAGLTLPVEDLIATSGNPTGSDSESPGRAQLTLRSDVLFHFNKSNLTPKARTILRSVARQIKARARGTVQITGYTDSIGSDAVNLPLSRARAHSVVTALTPLTSGVNYNSQGKGSADPVAPNTKPDGSDNPAGRALNRRVTIVFAAAPVRPAPPAPAAPASGAGAQSSAMTFHGFNTAGDTYRASGAALYRDGNLLILTMTLECAPGTPDHCLPLEDLAGTPTVPPLQVYKQDQGLSLSAYTTSGFYLLDPATGAEYIPLHRTDAVPVTSSLRSNMTVGDAYTIWSYFPAPPASATSLTLVSPSGDARIGPVQISGSPPATP